MGNRAVITTKEKGKTFHGEKNIGMYIHWNGGRDSVSAFLKYCKLRGFVSPEFDGYGWGKLAAVINNWGLNTDIDICERLDCNNWDNGVYLIENWEIVGREYKVGPEQTEYDLEGMLIDIDKAQPKDQQLGAAKIKEMLAKDENSSLKTIDKK